MPRESLSPRFALPGEVSLYQADRVLQKALLYAPSGSVRRSLSTNQACSPMAQQDGWFARGNALTRSIFCHQPNTNSSQTPVYLPRGCPCLGSVRVKKRSRTKDCPWLYLNEVF
ncbi:hypothetical protein N7456_007090 [Penicillium angulare]|uniref:Uncharacterized protein n=1 Tax=Penicillium angulare TaxID=116970 RepID=A0A9W9KCM1_9EURO|nr:hypothetical protein N7456_007090 [Penicillium angulare]